jgi:hypothetical protein
MPRHFLISVSKPIETKELLLTLRTEHPDEDITIEPVNIFKYKRMTRKRRR